MPKVVTLLGAVALVVIVVVLGVLLLPSCGLVAGAQRSIPSTWLSWCPKDAGQQTKKELAEISKSNQNLYRIIFERERELAAMQCETEPTATVAQATSSPQISPQDWVAGNIGSLQGCWSLDSPYRAVNENTGTIIHYNVWNMCFDGQGKGTSETSSSSHGIKCTGNANASFEANGSLVIQEQSNVDCNDNSFIYRRVIRCTRMNEGNAECISSQWGHRDSEASVSFRRAKREN